MNVQTSTLAMLPGARWAVSIALLCAACAGSSSNGGGGGQGGTSNGTGGSSTAGKGTGGSSTGGSSTGGSSTGGSSTGGSECASGTVTFHMTGAGESSDYCIGQSCLTSWVSIKSAAGDDYPLNPACVTSCEECQPIACSALCVAPQRVDPDGETQTWNGTYYEDATCGSNTSCKNKKCAPPGQYVATMCAVLDVPAASTDGCTNTGAEPTCVNVPFDYPSTDVVEGVLGVLK